MIFCKKNFMTYTSIDTVWVLGGVAPVVESIYPSTTKAGVWTSASFGLFCTYKEKCLIFLF